MNNYSGVIIEESLENRQVLERLKITSTSVEPVTEKHQTPWLSQWTLRWVEIPEGEAHEIAGLISRSFDTRHPGSWYADFRNETHHFIIFPGRVFFIDRERRDQYQEAARFGASLGIPERQLDFNPEE